LRYCYNNPSQFKFFDCFWFAYLIKEFKTHKNLSYFVFVDAISVKSQYLPCYNSTPYYPSSTLMHLLSPPLDTPVSLSGLRDLPGFDRSGNLEDAAYKQMRQALIDGHFSVGQSFTIRMLAQVFGTSPMPVRDALKRLVAEHALDLLPNRSVIVPLMSRARFQEITRIRLSLEPMITGLAAPGVSPQTIEAMAGDHQQMCEAVDNGDASRYLASNRRFHFRLYETAATTVMLPLIEGLWVQIGPYLNQVFRLRERGATQVARHHHTDILKALRRRDGVAAAQAIWGDLSDAADSILAANWFSP
jgi:DNA-binding GntR family transcriptional regulator